MNLKRILFWIKKHKMKLIISLICIIIVLVLVIKGMNIITVIFTAILGGSGLYAEKIIKKNKDLDKEKMKKINELMKKKEQANEKIDNLRGNTLANDVNNKYKKFKSK